LIDRSTRSARRAAWTGDHRTKLRAAGPRDRNDTIDDTTSSTATSQATSPERNAATNAISHLVRDRWPSSSAKAAKAIGGQSENP